MNVIEIAKNILIKLGYYSEQLKIITDIKKQSISQGVVLENSEIGAGDQVLCSVMQLFETKTYMPLNLFQLHMTL